MIDIGFWKRPRDLCHSRSSMAFRLKKKKKAWRWANYDFIWILAERQAERRWNSQCHKYVQLHLHALCLWIWCASGSSSPFSPKTHLLHKAGHLTLCHTPITRGFCVCLLTSHSIPKESTPYTKWNDLNLYGCLQGIPAPHMKTKDPMHEMSCGSRYIDIYTL